MILEEVQKDVSLKKMASSELERVKQQLAIEKKNVSEMSAELQALRTEMGNNKQETERFALVKKRFDERRYMQQPKVHLELEDAENAIAELKEEIAYKTSVNRSLTLQLEKTIESNSELLLEIKDLDDLLQSREREIEKLRGRNDSAACSEEEKAVWMEKLEESEKVIEELRAYIEEHKMHGETEDMDKLRSDFEKASRRCNEMQEENMNLLAQLMDLQRLTDDKDALLHGLESEVAAWRDLTPSAENASEKKLKELQCTVNDLRDKLRLSEELSQNQLDSNKALLEELSSTVDSLQAKNKSLEMMLQKSEDHNASLSREVSTLRKDIVEHEKERSLLMSQRGQMKALREKIAVITQNYEMAVNSIEELEGVNKTLREQKDEELARLKEQLSSADEKLHEMSNQYQEAKKDLIETQTQLRQKIEELNHLGSAKETAETSLISFRSTHKELQDHVNSLLLAKEKADASSRSSKAEQAALQQKLQESEEICIQRLRELQEANDTITMLTHDLDTAQDTLQKTYYKLAEAEIDKCGLLDRRHQGATEMDGNSDMERLQLQLLQTKQDMDELRRSLSASESSVHELKVENTDLKMKFSSVVSERNELDHRLKSAQQRESELDTKVEEMGRELLEIQNETAVYEQTMAQLESRLRFLGGERIDQEEKMIVQLQGLTTSHHAMLLEKEKAQQCIDKLQIDNAHLTKELAVWKDKAKAARHENAASEEKNANLCRAANPHKKAAELDLKSEIARLKKHASELKKKLSEQEEEKEEMKRKLAVFQREVQRKSELLGHSEKKLRENDKDDSLNGRQIKPTKHQSKTNQLKNPINTSTGMSQSVKAMANLAEKVKALEEQLRTKTIELEAAKFLLGEKEQICRKNAGNGAELDGKLAQDERDNQGMDCSQMDKLPEDVEAFRKLQEENHHLKSLVSRLSTPLQEGSITSRGDGGHVEASDDRKNMEGELREMKDRYSKMSLGFAELRAEKEELLMTIKNLRMSTASTA